MEFPIKFDTVKSGWSIVYTEGSQIIISKIIIFLSLKIDFGLANNADPDEMMHYARLGLILQQLIWVYNGCQSTCLRVSGTQRVKG